MCSETKTKIVRDIIAIVFVSAEENNCKLRNCRWKFQETANVVFATSKVWRILFVFAPHTALHGSKIGYFCGRYKSLRLFLHFFDFIDFDLPPPSVPEIIDPIFAKSSQNARFLLSENERFGLVFVKTSVLGLFSWKLGLKIRAQRSGEIELKEVLRRLFRKIRPPPILQEAFKVLERLLIFYLPIIQQFR